MRTSPWTWPLKRATNTTRITIDGGDTSAHVAIKTSSDAAAAVPTDDSAEIVLIRSTFATCTCRALENASDSRSIHSVDASCARTSRNESSESVTTACRSRLRSLNTRPSRRAGRIPLLCASANTTTATMAIAATPGATNRATIAVAIARTSPTAAVMSWLTAMPDRPAPSVMTWTMSLRRISSTNDQRAERIELNASWRSRSTISCWRRTEFTVEERVTSAWTPTTTTNASSSDHNGSDPTSQVPTTGSWMVSVVSATELTIGTSSRSPTPLSRPPMTSRTA